MDRVYNSFRSLPMSQKNAHARLFHREKLLLFCCFLLLTIFENPNEPNRTKREWNRSSYFVPFLIFVKWKNIFKWNTVAMLNCVQVIHTTKTHLPVIADIWNCDFRMATFLCKWQLRISFSRRYRYSAFMARAHIFTTG